MPTRCELTSQSHCSNSRGTTANARSSSRQRAASSASRAVSPSGVRRTRRRRRARPRQRARAGRGCRQHALARPVVESSHHLVAPFAGDRLADEGSNPAVTDDEHTPGPGRTAEHDRPERRQADRDDDGEQRLQRREAPSAQASSRLRAPIAVTASAAGDRPRRRRQDEPAGLTASKTTATAVADSASSTARPVCQPRNSDRDAGSREQQRQLRRPERQVDNVASRNVHPVSRMTRKSTKCSIEAGFHDFRLAFATHLGNPRATRSLLHGRGPSTTRRARRMDGGVCSRQPGVPIPANVFAFPS